jgi:hypothetical protein
MLLHAHLPFIQKFGGLPPTAYNFVNSYILLGIVAVFIIYEGKIQVPQENSVFPLPAYEAVLFFVSIALDLPE